MDSFEIIKSAQNSWLNENCSKSQFLSFHIEPLKPDLGNYYDVNGLEIFKDIFPEEYGIIHNAYYSAMDKLKKHYIKLKEEKHG